MVQRTPIERRKAAARSSTALALVAALALGGCATGATTGPNAQTTMPQKVQAQNSLQAMLRLAARTEGAGNLGAARQIYANAAKEYPEAPAAHLGLARLTYKAGQPRAAAEYYRTALRYAPNSAEARYGLGKALLADDRPEAAIEQFDRLLARDDSDHRPYLTKGVALDLLGRHAEAQRVYHAGLEIAPRNVALRNNLGLSLALSNEHKEAMRVLEDAARDPKATARTRQNLALVYGLAGEMDDAKMAGRDDLNPAAVERNLAYYQALRSARRAEREADETSTRTPASAADADAAPQPRRHQVAATAEADESVPASRPRPTDGGPTSLIAAPAAEDAPETTPKSATEGKAKAKDSAASQMAALPRAEADSDPGTAKAAGAGGARMPAPKSPDPAEPEAQTAKTDTKAGDDAAGMTATPVAYQPSAASAPEIQAAGKAYWVQIASFSSAETSRGEWSRLQAAHEDLLSELELSLQEAEVPGKGTFYRVRTGPFAGSSAPKRLCEALKARDQGCLVVRGDTAS